MHTQLFLFLGLFLAISNPCCSQTHVDLSPKAFAQSIASAREQIVSYRVEVESRTTVEKVDSNGVTKGDSSSLKESVDRFYFEFSRLESHFLCAKARSKNKEWSVIGQSDGLKLTASGTSLGVSKRTEVSPQFFDPLVCGLLHCEMFMKYWSFEDELLELSRNSDPSYMVEKTTDGMFILSNRSLGQRMIVDSKRGFWPISNEHHQSFDLQRLKDIGQDKIEKLVAQELTKVQGVYVPKVANFSCLTDKNRGRTRVKLNFNWIDVNGTIPTGEKAAQAIAQKLELNLVRLSEP